MRLADLLAERGQLDEAAQTLRARADVGDEHAAGRLAWRLVERAVGARRRPWADIDNMDAVNLLAERGEIVELRTRADAGDEYAAERLAVWLGWRLAERSDLDGLRAEADAGEGFAAVQLAELLAARGDLEEAVQILRGPADTGVMDAADLLADLLAMCGDLDGLRARVSVGHWHALDLLEDLLIDRGQDEEAQRLLGFGLNPDGSIAWA